MFEPNIDFYSSTNLKAYNLDQVMRYQLNMLENLDPFTRKHCENVANLTCRMCEYLHAKKMFTIHATTCAYLHDIGKLFIPQEILTKPTMLTDEEFEIMKTHTTIGYNMCMKDLKLRPYARWSSLSSWMSKWHWVPIWFNQKRYSLLCPNHTCCWCIWRNRDKKAIKDP